MYKDRLDIDELPEAKFRQFTSETATLYTSEWEFGVRFYDVVDEDITRLQFRDEFLCCDHIIRPYRSSEPILGLIGQTYSLLSITHPDERPCRPEYFLLKCPHTRLYIFQYDRSDEVASCRSFEWVIMRCSTFRYSV